jgi:hypothetical protein
MVGSLKMNTALEYSTRVVQEGDRRCKKSTLNDLAYLTPLRIPLMNPAIFYKLSRTEQRREGVAAYLWVSPFCAVCMKLFNQIKNAFKLFLLVFQGPFCSRFLLL